MESVAFENNLLSVQSSAAQTAHRSLITRNSHFKRPHEIHLETELNCMENISVSMKDRYNSDGVGLVTNPNRKPYFETINSQQIHVTHAPLIQRLDEEKLERKKNIRNLRMQEIPMFSSNRRNLSQHFFSSQPEGRCRRKTVFDETNNQRRNRMNLLFPQYEDEYVRKSIEIREK